MRDREFGGWTARGATRGRGDGAPLSAGEAWIPVSSLSESGRTCARAGPGAGESVLHELRLREAGGAASRLLGDKEAQAEVSAVAQGDGAGDWLRENDPEAVSISA